MYEPNFKLAKGETNTDTVVASINFFPDFNSLTLPEAKLKITDGEFLNTDSTLETDKTLS